MRKEESILNNNLYPVDDLIFSVVRFIDENIQDFKQYLILATSEYKQFNAIQKERLEQEDDISQVFCRFLDDSYSDFKFENQTKDPEKNGGTDIGIFRKYSKPRNIPFCIIEAKRLPTPIYKGRQPTEYVCYKNSTKQGGIERFKTNKHGSRLPTSIMVAFIQKNNSAYWYNEVNSWIENEILTSSNITISWGYIDKLIAEPSFIKPKITKYYSEHSRIPNSNIKLVHYWIDLT